MADARLQAPYDIRLALPDTMRSHLVFHVSLMEHAADNPSPGQRVEPQPQVEVDGQEEYHVVKILDSRDYGRWRTL